ncbi:MAG: NGG1p interacting factor NIF3 [Gammaproteobacteria bacterium RIFCSPHIGHO2_12_FULL_42_10]|nr:MAG: NGG1p interacting factor NIF3 [Gammaproteobacteria bacterium RIFCSPHIGHO2_12_FULL_42_10]
MYKICCYVPVDYAEPVKNALFKAGAGKIGNYSYCAFQVLGAGQFLPEAGSHPTIGQKNQLEIIQEYKIELVCDKKYITNAIHALRKAHPYEEPAYQVIRIENF